MEIKVFQASNVNDPIATLNISPGEIPRMGDYIVLEINENSAKGTVVKHVVRRFDNRGHFIEAEIIVE